MKVPRCRGTRDLLPQDMVLFRRGEEVFRSCCQSWGYREIRTPTLEYLHLFTSAGTLSPARLSRVYSFLDWDGWSGERVVLRPDGTIPAARLYVENLSHLHLARLFYVENIFSFEGETRERWQCGAELIGGLEPKGEAELLMLAQEVLSRLGLRAEVRLSHLGLLRGLVGELALGKEEAAELLKLFLQGDGGAVDRARSRSPEVAEVLSLLLNVRQAAHGFLENLKGLLFSTLPHLAGYAADLAQVAQLLDWAGASYQVDFALGQEFEYYTGVVFQFRIEAEVVGGGGRYDELIPLIGGRKIPAAGFALYLDKLMNFLQPPPEAGRVLLKSKFASGEDAEATFEFAKRLRSKGWVVELETGPLEAANCDWVVELKRQGKKLLFDLQGKAGQRLENLSEAKALEKLKEGHLPLSS